MQKATFAALVAAAWFGLVGGGRRFCRPGQWCGYCRIRALGRSSRASPRLVRTWPAPKFWTLRSWMRTWVVPALPTGTLPPQVIACGISGPGFAPEEGIAKTIDFIRGLKPAQTVGQRAPATSMRALPILPHGGIIYAARQERPA
jgi:hypothetical protein